MKIHSRNCPYYNMMNPDFLIQVNTFLGSIPNLPDFKITSSWRSPEKNKLVGGLSNSYHLVGKALDLVFPSGFVLPKYALFDIIYYPVQGFYHVEPSPINPLGTGRKSIMSYIGYGVSESEYTNIGIISIILILLYFYLRS